MLNDQLEFKHRRLRGKSKMYANGNAYDRGDYNSSFALRAVELKYIEDIQMFLLNMAFISSSEVKNIYIS